MPYYIPKPESYGRIHPEFGTLTEHMKPVFTNWSGPQLDWVEVAAPDAVVAAVAAAPFEKSKPDSKKIEKKNKPVTDEPGEEF